MERSRPQVTGEDSPDYKTKTRPTTRSGFTVSLSLSQSASSTLMNHVDNEYSEENNFSCREVANRKTHHTLDIIVQIRKEEEA